MNCTAKIAAAGLTLLSLAASSSSLFGAEKAILAERAAAAQQVDFDVYIPVQHRAELERDLEALNNPSSSSYHKWLTPEQTAQRYGASAKQVAAIQNQLVGYGLQTSVVNGYRIHVTGTAGAAEQAFGTVLRNGRYSNGKKMVAATEFVTPPAALAAIGAVVVGLSNTMQMRTYSHPLATSDNRYSPKGAYWFDDLKQAYAFPSYTSYTGKGATIATLVSGAYGPADMAKYFGHELLAVPNFSEINVDGGSLYDNTGFGSFETNLDFQQAGGMAPNASIIHYNLPDLTDQSIVDGLAQIITDNKADIVSMSFGLPELFYTAEYNGGMDYTSIPKLEDDLFALGNLQGITFVASSGDTGAVSVPPVACFPAADGDPFPKKCGHMRASASFPATSPHVTAVGGTNLVTSYDGVTRNSAYYGEQAYGDPLSVDLDYGTNATGNIWGSGGGNSIIFAKPTFQILADTGSKKFRTVPDVSGHMGGCPGGVSGVCDPEDSADYEVYHNLYYGVIGTSASAPDFAGLLALTEQSFGGNRLGNVNSYVYTLALAQSLGVTGKVYNQGIPGYNGLYFGTGAGYNRVLGNGTVNGTQFLLAPTLPTAGVPQTPSNP